MNKKRINKLLLLKYGNKASNYTVAGVLHPAIVLTDIKLSKEEYRELIEKLENIRTNKK